MFLFNRVSIVILYRCRTHRAIPTEMGDTWEDDLRYILRDVQQNVDSKAVQGTNPQWNVVQGAWDPQSPTQSYILNNVCQSTTCN